MLRDQWHVFTDKSIQPQSSRRNPKFAHVVRQAVPPVSVQVDLSILTEILESAVALGIQLVPINSRETIRRNHGQEPAVSSAPQLSKDLVVGLGDEEFVKPQAAATEVFQRFSGTVRIDPFEIFADLWQRLVSARMNDGGFDSDEAAQDRALPFCQVFIILKRLKRKIDVRLVDFLAAHEVVRGVNFDPF